MEQENRLTDQLEVFLTDGDWKYQLEEKERFNLFTFKVGGKHGVMSLRIVVRESVGLVCIYNKLPVSVPEEKRSDVGEFLSRANYGLIVGNFETDFRDGEIRFKSSADYEDTIISKITLRNLLLVNLSTSDKYYPALMKMIWGNISAKDAIKEVEGE